jgi:hypothetical protein
MTLFEAAENRRVYGTTCCIQNGNEIQEYRFFTTQTQLEYVNALYC